MKAVFDKRMRIASAVWLALAISTASSTAAQTLSRGPYLQNSSTKAVTVRWRTSSSTDSVLRYGTADGNLTQSLSNATATTEHELRLTDLLPDTRYYYSVGYSVGGASTTLASGASYFFVTAPSVARPTRVWVIGDAGTNTSGQTAVRDAYYSFTGSRGTDLWLMLGDNAYENGTDAEYQSAVFNVYGDILRNAVLWPTLGNHDARSASSASQTGAYYDMFTLPRSAEAGGVASGTEAYYSFDYANIHFVCLSSYDVSRSATGPMLTWMENDLAANTKDWLVAFFHHPPYSRGSHNSDAEIELIEMRQNALPILEHHGVDLVLSGHSHAYERSFLIDGHYGPSSTFNGGMVFDAGSGREDGSGAYLKSNVGPVSHDGTVYAVAGASGKTEGGTLNHPAMFTSIDVLGSMVIDVDGPRLDVQYIDSTGTRRDYFTLFKDGSAPPRSVTVSFRNGVDGYSGMVDASLRSDKATTSYGSWTTLLADGSPDWSAVMRWDLSSIRRNKIVTQAQLTLRVSNASPSSYELYALKRAFTESQVTWQRASSSVHWQTVGANGTQDRETTVLAVITSALSGTRTITLNAAGLAKLQSWIRTPASNFGFVLLDYTPSDGIELRSSEHSTISQRPQLTITYR